MYCDSKTLQTLITKRNKNSKKGDFGKVLIIGGSEDYIGAPVLAANAALSILRTGVDWVTVAAPSKVAWAINSISPDIITKKIDCKYFSSDNILELKKFSKKFDTILIGPGIGILKETILFCKNFLKIFQQIILLFLWNQLDQNLKLCNHK